VPAASVETGHPLSARFRTLREGPRQPVISSSRLVISDMKQISLAAGIPVNHFLLIVVLSLFSNF
jgi:hypothetical protein